MIKNIFISDENFETMVRVGIAEIAGPTKDKSGFYFASEGDYQRAIAIIEKVQKKKKRQQGAE